MGVVFPGGKYMGGNFHRGEYSQWGIFIGGNFLGGNFPDTNIYMAHQTNEDPKKSRNIPRKLFMVKSCFDKITGYDY